MHRDTAFQGSAEKTTVEIEISFDFYQWDVPGHGNVSTESSHIREVSPI
jgi:hypothetical protein